jgi:hypothetical protein
VGGDLIRMAVFRTALQTNAVALDKQASPHRLPDGLRSFAFESQNVG